MKKLTLLTLLPQVLFAQNMIPSHIKHIAEPIPVPSQPQYDKQEVAVFDESTLRLDQQLTESLLSKAIYTRQLSNMEKLVSIYQDFPKIDFTLLHYTQGKIALLRGHYTQAIALFRAILAENPTLNTVRIELAIALLYDLQLNAAEEQFDKAMSASDLPPAVKQMIEQYQQTLRQKQQWQFSLSSYYIKDRNINKTSQAAEIEQTGYIKQPNLLPQTAQGIHYQFELQRDFNLSNSHYLTVGNTTQGELYWDNHRYDEITNRTLFGYSYKKNRQTTRLLPFYEKRWKPHHSEHWKNGVRLEHAYWLSPKWQLAAALEYAKKRYFEQPVYNGNYKLASTTLLWLHTPQQLFFGGIDFHRDQTTLKQHSADTIVLRLGWQQEWQTLGLSSRLTLSYSDRRYKDIATLGNKLNLGKIRHDKVNHANLTLWKRNWHWLGLTPKLQLSYTKHRSNLPTLYTYTEKNINVIVESRF